MTHDRILIDINTIISVFVIIKFINQSIIFKHFYLPQIYHSFHAEVREYKQHWWRCDGICKNVAPYFGWVKRSMNRAPGPNDGWFESHKNTCGGKFTKVKEPENYINKKSQKS